MTPARLGRYEITGTLGRGAMGVVYSARDPLIERIVAIKTVACAGLSEREAAEFEQRFFREAKSAGRLNHPNIVTVYDAGRDGDLAWIAMEFLSGRSLRDLLDAKEALSPGRIVGIAAAVADALAFAHAQGIVHRDVKPANIMVLDSGVVKLADFGIAQVPGSGLTMTGAVLGSPKYMAPEQIAGQKADGRSDIFSLGVVLYEMLAGKPPFGGDNLHAAMYQVVHREPPPPSACNGGTSSAAFDTIVAKALAKDPAARYQNAAELASDLRRALRAPEKHGAEKSRPPAASAVDAAPSANAAAPAGRRRLSVAVGGMLLLLAAAALLYWRLAAKPGVTEAPAAAASPPQARRVDSSPPPSPEPPRAAPATAAADAPAAATREAPAVQQAERPRPRPLPPRAERKPGDAAVRPAAPPDWRALLRADLAACEALPVFRRVLCMEKARWRHCPGHWGEIDDCPSGAAEQERRY